MKKGLLYGLVGGLCGSIGFMILQNLIHATDAIGFIFIATIILTIVICFCTGNLIDCISKKM